MKNLLIYILLGLGFAAPGEILNQILARQNLRAFGSTMISYTVLLLVGFFVGKAISTAFTKCRARLIYYLAFGSLGLMVEWFLLGNAPALEPFQLITQPGMFTFWGTMLLAPCLVMEPGFQAVKRSFLRFFAAFTILYLSVGFIVPRAKGGIFFAFVLFATGYTALNYFYAQYFKALRKNCEEQFQQREPGNATRPACHALDG